MKVRQPRYSKEEFARQAIYEQRVRPLVSVVSIVGRGLKSLIK